MDLAELLAKYWRINDLCGALNGVALRQLRITVISGRERKHRHFFNKSQGKQGPVFLRGQGMSARKYEEGVNLTKIFLLSG